MKKDKQKEKVLGRVHPLFPSHHEIMDHPEFIYSNHLPVMFEVPIDTQNTNDGENETENQPIEEAKVNYTLRIISWNVLGNDAPSGFHKQLSDWENTTQARQRFKRIAIALKKIRKIHNPDIIVLQKADSVLILKYLNKYLPGWVIKDSEHGRIMCYPHKYTSDRLEPVAGTYIDIKKDMHNAKDMQSRQVNIFTFAGQKVEVSNVHTQYYPTPENHEAYYGYILKTNEDVDFSVVVGDTNTRIAPISNDPKYIATGVVPMRFNEENGAEPDQQITDFSDGAYMRDKQNKVIQLKRYVLDPTTGNIFDDNLPRNSKSVHSRNPRFIHWPDFRMVMCLDDDSQQKYTDFFTLEERLNKLYPGDRKIIVRPAAKDNNERGIGISVSDNNDILKCFSEVDGGSTSMQIIYQNRNENGERFPIIYLSQQYVKNFLDMYKAYDELLKLAKDFNAIYPGRLEYLEDKEEINEIKFMPITNMKEITIALTISKEHSFYEFILSKVNTNARFREIFSEIEQNKTMTLQTINIEPNKIGEFQLLFLEFLNIWNKANEAVTILEKRMKDIRASEYHPFLCSGADKIQSLNMLCDIIRMDWLSESLANIVNDWSKNNAPYYSKYDIPSQRPNNLKVIDKPRNIFRRKFYCTLLCNSNNLDIATVTNETLKTISEQASLSKNND